MRFAMIFYLYFKYVQYIAHSLKEGENLMYGKKIAKHDIILFFLFFSFPIDYVDTFHLIVDFVDAN